MSTEASAPNSLPAELAERWNRFWFIPSDPLPLCVLRIGVGLCFCLYLLILSPDVGVWLGDQGLLPRELYRQLVLDSDTVNRFAYWSIFSFLGSPAQVQAVHYLCLLIAILFTAGVLTRVTSVLALVALLQYVHRMPLLTGHVEPLLSFLLLYLCLGPCGAALSFDAWRHGRLSLRESTSFRGAKGDTDPTWTATISLRLIQVHLALFYVMMATAKLQGDVWWRGDAIWTLMSPTRSRLLDWTFIRNATYIINLWTLVHLYYELTFAALIWNRFTRPIMLWLGLVLWLLMLLASGLVNFSLLMIVANLAFVPAATWRRVLRM